MSTVNYQLPTRFAKINLHSFFIMLNHMHGIIEISDENHMNTSSGKAVVISDSDKNRRLLSTALPLRLFHFPLSAMSYQLSATTYNLLVIFQFPYTIILNKILTAGETDARK